MSYVLCTFPDSPQVLERLSTCPPTGAEHEICDAGRILAVQLDEAKGRLSVPMPQDTMEILRQNAIKTGLLGEFLEDRFL